MVHRTDIAASVGCMGQGRSGLDHFCRHAPDGALSEKKAHLSETCTCSCSRRFMTVIPVHAVQCRRAWPDQASTPKHCKTRDDIAVQQT